MARPFGIKKSRANRFGSVVFAIIVIAICVVILTRGGDGNVVVILAVSAGLLVIAGIIFYFSRAPDK